LTKVVFTYMLIYGFEAGRRNRTDFPITLQKIRNGYPQGWPSGVYGVPTMMTELKEMESNNPFEGYSGDYPFEVAQRSVARAIQTHGKWSNMEECRALKDTLQDLDRDGTGRVRLVDFYKKKSVGNNWFFEETPEYLRAQGVLDETCSSRGLQLIFPNYVQVLSNCIEVSQFYSICCLRECDGLTRITEQEIRAPTAEPAQILQVVQRLVNERALQPVDALRVPVRVSLPADEGRGGAVSGDLRVYQADQLAHPPYLEGNEKVRGAERRG